MKKIMMILVAVVLVALPTIAQSFSNQEQQAFQSTSTLQGSGSAYSSKPVLNADGTAFNPAEASVSASAPSQAPTGPRKINPIAAPTPVGDAVLPLMLMALALGGIIALRRRRALNG